MRRGRERNWTQLANAIVVKTCEARIDDFIEDKNPQ
jgi:hypothetical protein